VGAAGGVNCTLTRNRDEATHMGIAALALVGLAGAAAGGIVGFAFGFAMNSHHDVLRGIRPDTQNRFLLFMCRPTAGLRPIETLVMFLLVCGWLALFFLLVAAPAIAAQHFTPDHATAPLIAYGAFLACAWALSRLGAHAWRTLV
jgi:hypothetical protein